MSRIFGPRWPYWLGVMILSLAAIEALFRDFDRATYLLVLGWLVLGTAGGWGCLPTGSAPSPKRDREGAS